jgi:hypothetical protein
MGQREVVLGVKAILGQRINMIDVELTLVEHQVYGLIAYEALAELASHELLLKHRTLIAVQAG